MKKILFLFIASVLLQSCDDGDIIVTSFNFDDAKLENCGNLGNYVFYKVNPAARESLSLRMGVTDSLYKTAGVKTYPINGTTNFVNYRTYGGDLGTNYFCSSVPPTSPLVAVDYIASAGTVVVTTEFIYDDEDGVSSDMEFNGDTDGDGIPNIYDFDDDGDNIPTSRELGISDYLNGDDDGDDVLTRDEDKDGDLDPTNDITDQNVGPDYLNPNIAVKYEATKYRQHTYKIFKTVKIVLKDLVLVNGDEELIIETLNMGTIENVEIIEIRTTPEL